MDPLALLETYLRQLRLMACVQHYQRLAEQATQANLSYERFLLALLEQELAERHQQRQSHCIKQARFPVLKELADFDFSALPSLNRARVLDLARGDYIAQAETVLLVGNPGLGKTHIATSLALAACRQGQRVRFYTAAGLVNDLLVAQEGHRLSRFLDGMLKQRLVVLDELGFLPLSPIGAQLIFQFCSALHERVALIITTNLRFADWTQVFGSESLTAALLDRLTARSHILEFIGESYRLRQRRRREEGGWLNEIVPTHNVGAGPETDLEGPAVAFAGEGQSQPPGRAAGSAPRRSSRHA
jgi:DNA replication protein DnaC